MAKVVACRAAEVGCEFTAPRGRMAEHEEKGCPLNTLRIVILRQQEKIEKLTRSLEEMTTWRNQQSRVIDTTKHDVITDRFPRYILTIDRCAWGGRLTVSPQSGANLESPSLLPGRPQLLLPGARLAAESFCPGPRYRSLLRTPSPGWLSLSLCVCACVLLIRAILQDVLDIAQVQRKVLQELDVLPSARPSTPFLNRAGDSLALSPPDTM